MQHKNQNMMMAAIAAQNKRKAEEQAKAEAADLMADEDLYDEDQLAERGSDWENNIPPRNNHGRPSSKPPGWDTAAWDEAKWGGEAGPEENQPGTEPGDVPEPSLKRGQPISHWESLADVKSLSDMKEDQGDLSQHDPSGPFEDDYGNGAGLGSGAGSGNGTVSGVGEGAESIEKDIDFDAYVQSFTDNGDSVPLVINENHTAPNQQNSETITITNAIRVNIMATMNRFELAKLAVRDLRRMTNSPTDIDLLDNLDELLDQANTDFTDLQQNLEAKDDDIVALQKELDAANAKLGSMVNRVKDKLADKTASVLVNGAGFALGAIGGAILNSIGDPVGCAIPAKIVSI